MPDRLTAGLSPFITSRNATETSEAATVLQTERLGAIAPERTADLVVVAGNPLQEIQATQNVIMVFREGRQLVDRREEDS